jgi:hypothetical protein
MVDINVSALTYKAIDLTPIYKQIGSAFVGIELYSAFAVTVWWLLGKLDVRFSHYTYVEYARAILLGSVFMLNLCSALSIVFS